jgi:hypothetical protein
LVKRLFSLWFDFETVKLQYFPWNFKNFALDVGVFCFLSFAFGYLTVIECHYRQHDNFINKQNKKKKLGVHEQYLPSSDEECNTVRWRKPCLQGGGRRVSVSPLYTGGVCGIIVVGLACMVFSFSFFLFPTQFSSWPSKKSN